MELELGASWSTEDLGTLPQLITTSGFRPGTALQAHLHSSKIRHRLYFNTIYMRVHNCVRHTHVAAAADSTVHEAVLTWLFFLLLLPLVLWSSSSSTRKIKRVVLL